MGNAGNAATTINPSNCNPDLRTTTPPKIISIRYRSTTRKKFPVAFVPSLVLSARAASPDDRITRTVSNYIGAIDQGTTSTRFIVFDHSGRIVSVAQREHE